MGDHATTIDQLIIGDSPAVRQLRALITRFGPMRIPVLVQGPTGAGKDLVARALHLASGRTGGFVAFNVCAVSDTMFEDALFGHVRGAFTGATSDVPGYLAEANGGTVFFDEISGLGIGPQVKLLRAVETGVFRSVGAVRDRMSDFRVVAASNEDLNALVVDGRFRKDLLHRLGGVVLAVPALAARIEDVRPLAQHFLHCAGFSAHMLTAGALRLLEQHDWPGNVRELRHALERAAVLADGGGITRDAIDAALSVPGEQRVTSPSDECARRQLVAVLESCEWDKGCTAERLGVHLSTVYRWMGQLGIPMRPITPAGSRVIAIAPADAHVDTPLGSGDATPVRQRDGFARIRTPSRENVRNPAGSGARRSS